MEHEPRQIAVPSALLSPQGVRVPPGARCPDTVRSRDEVQKQRVASVSVPVGFTGELFHPHLKETAPVFSRIGGEGAHGDRSTSLLFGHS